MDGTCLGCSDPAIVTLRLKDGGLAPLCAYHLEQDARPCVYFFLAASAGVVKIGFAKNWQRRLEQIQAMSPLAVDLWHLVEGDYTTEAELHKQFAEHRSHGEWFRVADEIVDFVKPSSPDAISEFSR